MKNLIIILVLFLIGCVTQTDKLLTGVGYKFKGQGNCRVIAEKQVEYLKGLGYQAEVVHCEARDRYSWDHAICKVYIDNKWWIVPDGLVMDIPWEYNEVKKYCYDFILP
jgi:hypothetical protein